MISECQIRITQSYQSCFDVVRCHHTLLTQSSCLEGDTSPRSLDRCGLLTVRCSEHTPLWCFTTAVVRLPRLTHTADQPRSRLAQQLCWHRVFHFTAPMAMLGDGLDELRCHIVYP